METKWPGPLLAERRNPLQLATTSALTDLQSFAEPNTLVRFAPHESRRWRHGGETHPQPPLLPSAASPLKADPLAHEGQVRHGPAQLLVDRLGEGGRRSRLAMHDVGMLGRRVEAAQPG